MKEFSILSQLKCIIFTLVILAIPFQYLNAQSAIQNQLGSNIKFVVAKDGSGNYTTIQAAINAIPNNSKTSQVIFIKKGTYTEKVEIPGTKIHLVLIGEDVNTTIIAYGDYSGSGKIYNGIISYANGTAIGTSTSHTLFASADDFTMMNITVKNTAGDVGQAVALNSNADRQFYYHCKILGNQDTYLTWSSTRFYLKDCYLEGAVDYIFGAGVALFDSCQLNSVRSSTCITAASTGLNFKFGYVFQNCKITSNSGVTGVFLGRPWYANCQVVFMNSEESSVITPAGWSKWGSNNNYQTCYYAEYKNCGAGSGISNRATWTHQLTAAQAATYTRANIFNKNVNPTPYSANWDPNPEGDIFYTIVNKNTNPFITSACFSPVTPPAPPKKYIYTYDNSGNLSWSNTNSWTPKAVPRDIDTVIIRTGEVQIANLNHTAPVYVETNGILRLIDTSTVTNLHLQGGTLKANTSAPGMMLTSNITVEQPSTILAGSVASTIFTLNGTLTGNANLTKTSVGNLRINSTATGFKGNWIISEGKIQLRSATGLGVCGVQVQTGARLDIEVAGASIYSLVVASTGGIDLDQPLAANVAVFGSENILSGAYKNTNYPAYIGSTSTLNVSNSLISLNGPASFCTGNSLILTASSGTSYIWKNNTTQVATNTAYKTTVAGSYTVAATNTAGCKVTSAPVVTTVNPLPTATITSPATSFCTGGSVLFSANTGTGLTYKWANASGTMSGATSATYTATTAGAYSVEVTNTNGCKATSAVTQITVSTLPSATITAPVTSFCIGGSVLLSANTGTGLTYKWSNASGVIMAATSATYTATAAGPYFVEVTNTTGCKTTSAITQITVNTLPSATITAPGTSFCTGGSVLLSANTGTGLTYKWSNTTGAISGATSATYNATTAGSYSVEVTNASGCKATSAPATITQGAMQLIPTISSLSTSFCTGGSVVLTASTGSSYKWFNGATQVGTAATYTATTAGTYTVEVTNTSGCKATSAVTQITASILPTATITAPVTSFCKGSSVILSASTGTGLTYQWSNASGTIAGATNGTYTVIAADAYTLEVTNASGCKATSAIKQITVNTLPVAIITSASTSFCTGGSVVLTSSAGSSYKWFNEATQVGTAATYTATTTGSYTVEVTNANVCKATSAVTQITVTTGTVWYADSDGDGKGDPAVSQTACTQPIGYVSVAGDDCPIDASKTTPGACGCGQLETDTDGDGSPDCIDSDDDNDGVTDTNDCQPLNAAVSSITTWYQDTDGDGKGDPSSTLNACAQPTGYVSTADDTCPSDPDKGTPGNCGCGNKESSCLDCAGIPNGTAVFDNCNICTGGTTGKSACVTTATVNGTTATITVIPQPFDHVTTIKLENNGNIQSITIINAAGELVDYKSGINNTEIQLGEELAAGLYSVIIQTDKAVLVSKIVKK